MKYCTHAEEDKEFTTPTQPAAAERMTSISSRTSQEDGKLLLKHSDRTHFLGYLQEITGSPMQTGREKENWSMIYMGGEIVEVLEGFLPVHH